MSQVISLHVGQAGVQTGNSLWELLCLEHGVRPDGTLRRDGHEAGNHSAFFSEAGKGDRVSPRALLVDTEHVVVDQVRTGVYKKLYNPATIINAGKEDASSCFARGYCSVGKEMIDRIMEQVRILAAACDSVQGFMLYHSCGGGTGSGLTALLAERLRDEYKHTVAELAFNHSPQVTNKMSGAVVEPYNTVLAAHKLTTHTDWCVMLDNEALYDVCQRKLDVDLPRYMNANRIVAQTVACVTAAMRDTSEMNLTLTDLQLSLVPYPRLKFLLASLAPLSNRALKHRPELVTVPAITRQAFRPDHHLARFDPRHGRYLACCLLYRGDVASRDINKAVEQIKQLGRFADHCPTGFQIGVTARPPCKVPFSDLDTCDRACALLSNTTASKEMWSTVNTKFDKMFRHRAFTHWYLNEGMDLEEFVEARDNMAALELDYDEVGGS